MDFSDYFSQFLSNLGSGTAGYNVSDAPGVASIPAPTKNGRPFDPTGIDGYGQGYVAGNNTAPPIAQAVQATQAAPSAPQGASAAPQATDPNTGLPVRASQFDTGLGMPGSGAGLLSYLGNPVLNGSQDTPISNAMAPQAPTTTMGQATAAQDPSNPYGDIDPRMVAMWKNQAQNPNNALSNSLIAAGSAILGGKDFQSGLAAGGNAFNDTFDKTLTTQRDLNTPKVVPMADGAFSMVQLPGQQPQVVRNDQVAGFLQGQKILQGQIELNKAYGVQQMKQQGQDNQQARAQGYENNAKLLQTNNMLQNMDDAYKVVANDDDSGARQLAAKFPGMAGALGVDGAAKNKILANVSVDKQLVQGALQKGAITNQEASAFTSDVPSATDANSVWRAWIERNKPIMQKIQASQQNIVNAGANAGAPGLTASTPASSSTGPVSINSKADFDALPSGATFKAPDGTLRRKP